jgi:hypothetical protein
LLAGTIINDDRWSFRLFFISEAELISIIPDVPETPEVFIENSLFPSAFGQSGTQRPIEIFFFQQINRIQGSESIHLLGCADTGSVPSQPTAKTHYICAEFTAQSQVIKASL